MLFYVGYILLSVYQLIIMEIPGNDPGTFSIREYHDMLLIYGEAKRNCYQARRLYRERFPNRRCPNPRTIVAVSQRVLDTGSVVVKKVHGRPRSQEVLAAEEQILNRIEDNPGLSVNQMAQDLHVSRYVVHRTLREQLLRPYHLQRVQDLQEQDYPQRVEFCRWLIRKCENSPLFTKKILVTDEASFTREGIFNFHNVHVWSDENQHVVRRTNFQHRFGLNVWAGFVDNQLIGPFVLPPRLTGEVYRNFLQNILPTLLDNVSLEIRRNMWFMHDGAPAHYSRIVREYLDDTFTGRWIGRNGPVAWPPRSPDLNPMDFYVWGHMKSLVYENEINTEEELRERIFIAAETIQNNVNVNESVRQNWKKRCEACVRVGGRHFEQLL